MSDLIRVNGTVMAVAEGHAHQSTQQAVSRKRKPFWMVIDVIVGVDVARQLPFFKRLSYADQVG